MLDRNVSYQDRSTSWEAGGAELRIKSQWVALQDASGKIVGLDGGGQMPVDTTAYIDAKTDAVRAQNDARFAEVLANFQTMHNRLDRVPSIWQIAGVFLSTLGVALAILSFAGDRFDAGVGLSEQWSRQAATDVKQDQKLDLVIDRLDRVSDRLEDLDARLPPAK